MTDEEKILLRKENVRRLFWLTGDEFVREVLDKYRSEDPAPASEICEQYDVSTYELMGSRWYKIRAKGVVPRGKTEKILYLHGGDFVLETGAAEYLAILEQRNSMVSYLSVPTVAKLWRGSLGEGDYRWNPVCGDFHSLPPILLFTGTGEVLNLAARHFADGAKAQGVEIQYYEKEMMQHCWILFPGEDNQEEGKIVVERLLR